MAVTTAKRPEIKKLHERARWPKYVRLGAAVVFSGALLAVFVGLFVARGEPEFRLRPGDALLSKDVIAEINGYERSETEGDVRKYYIKADKATTFADNHQELENVFIEVFAENGAGSDRITSRKAIYIPADNKSFTAYFAGDVIVDTRDELRIKTDHVRYQKSDETADADGLVEFERGGIRGRARGALVRIADKKVDLLNEVEIDALPTSDDPELAESGLRYAHLTSASASLDQHAETISMKGRVAIDIEPAPTSDSLRQPTEIRAESAVAKFENRVIRRIDLNENVAINQKPTERNAKWLRSKSESAKAEIDKELKSAEMTGNVQIETAGGQQKPTRISSGYALYQKDADRFTLRDAVNIVTVEDEKPARVTGQEAVYEQTRGLIVVTGGATVATTRETVKGDRLTAELYPSRKIKTATSRGNAELIQIGEFRTLKIAGDELNTTFAENEDISSAKSAGATRIELVPLKPVDYSRVDMRAPRGVRMAFRAGGLAESMTTDGRTTIEMLATGAAPSTRKIIADQVQTYFGANGRDLGRAEAVGNAELHVLPRDASEQNFQTVVTAPRFDCDFFPTNNDPRVCVGQLKTKTVRTPTVPSPTRGVETLTADRLTATFDEKTRDLSQLDAAGSAKVTELDRTGIAETMSYAVTSRFVTLRGGEPTVWDSSARARATEIDWDMARDKSFLRGGVSTTYYSQKQTGGATPFTQSGKPVFVTAATAEFDHIGETGLYRGEARAWQENNYVRSDQLLIRQKEGQLAATGNVQSVLYDTKKKEKGRDQAVPVYASASKMNYNRANRFLQYEENVDLRQGTDRITGGRADIYLNERNEMSKTIVESDVVITQPVRRGTGNWVQYTTADEVAILRGNPARVEDQENGTAQGAQLTVFMRENRVESESKAGQTNTGRTRTVYKVKKN